MITVLMAVFNGGKYLHASIRSVLEQSYRDFEFLIIDDCSTDNTVEIIESFSDKRVKVHKNANNVGQTKSLNIGMRLASRAYVARIDADDIALPKWLATQINGIKYDMNCSVMSAYAFAIDEQNRIKKLYKPPLVKERIIIRSLIASPINHVGSVLKKKDILEIGGYDEYYVTAADFDLWGKLLRNNYKIATTPKILMAIREHDQSLSRLERDNREIKEIINIAGKNIARFSGARLSQEEVELFCRAHYGAELLTELEFAQAVEISKRVYKNLVASLKITFSRKEQLTCQHCRTIYLKRIFAAIERNDYPTVRAASRAAIREFGILSYFALFWLLSFLGGMVLNTLPTFYYKLLRQKARQQLGVDLDAGIFH